MGTHAPRFDESYLDHKRLEARSRGINRGCVASAAGTNDYNFVHGLISETIKWI